jgi:hypothetical protein
MFTSEREDRRPPLRQRFGFGRFASSNLRQSNGTASMTTLITIAALASLGHLWAQTPSSAFSTPWLTERSDETRFAGLLSQVSEQSVEAMPFEITTITPSSAVIELDRATVFIDPVGSQSRYARFGRPDIVVLTRAGPGHLSIDTMIGMLRRDTVVLAPQAVIDRLPLMISNNTVAPFSPGTTQVVEGIRFTALSPAANIPRSAQVYRREHGDIAVVMEVDGWLVYF